MSFSGNKFLALAQGFLSLGKAIFSHRAHNPRTSSELLAHYTLQFLMARQSHPASWVMPVLTRLCCAFDHNQEVGLKVEASERGPRYYLLSTEPGRGWFKAILIPDLGQLQSGVTGPRNCHLPALPAE